MILKMMFHVKRLPDIGNQTTCNLNWYEKMEHGTCTFMVLQKLEVKSSVEAFDVYFKGKT